MAVRRLEVGASAIGGIGVSRVPIREIRTLETETRTRVESNERIGEEMAAKKKTRAKAPAELIISKSRTKAAVKKCNVGGEFYGALDQAVRGLIKAAEERAVGNKRKTLKAVDL
jgi:hypothetical protein